MPVRTIPLTVTAALTALVCPLSSLHAQEGEEWSIEESRAPSTRTLDFVATEGTWMSVDVSPDGARLAFDLLGHIYEMSVQGGEARALTSGRSWNSFPRYSPDGSGIAFTSDRGGSEDLWVLWLANDSLENISESPRPVVRPTWSANGQALFGSALQADAGSRGVRYSLSGGQQTLMSGGTFQPINELVEDATRGLIFYEQLDQPLQTIGARLKIYHLDTGEAELYRDRPGGAMNPAVSPDGRYLAYVHRDDQETVVVLHDLDSREERVIARGLDRDHQEYGPYYLGAAPGMGWHPGGRELFLAYGGRIRAVDVQTGSEREIPFQARVQRELDETIRFPVDVPEGKATTLAHRWPVRTSQGIIFEALGDIYLKSDDGLVNLTDSPEHETSPAFDPNTGTLYYARWSDDSLGAVFAMPLGGVAPRALTTRPSQYGSLTVSPDGNLLAFVRGNGELQTGTTIEFQLRFELVVRDRQGAERVIADVSGTFNNGSRMPFSIAFDPDGERLYYTEFINDTLTLHRLRLDGLDKATLYRFPNASHAVVSPDMAWIGYREYHRTYVTPFEFVGKPVSISAMDGMGFSKRVGETDGSYLAWSNDSKTLSWSGGGILYERALTDILEDSAEATTTPLAFEYEVDTPTSTIALTDVRVITMDPGRNILEGATILVRGSRIAEVGTGLAIPDDARVYDLGGHTVMPGMVDSHAHFNPFLSHTHVVEQRVPGVLGGLVHGVTTMVELYGTAEKDFWVMDMLRSGRLTGSRLFSVGSPLFGLKDLRPKIMRPVSTYEDALEHVRYNQAAGATVLKDYVNFTRHVRHKYATAARELGINLVAETAGNAPMNFTQIIDGLTGLEHTPGLTPLYQDIIELFKASEIGVTPTLLVVYNGPEGQSFFNQSVRMWENEKLLRFARKDRLVGYRRSPHYWDDDLYAPDMAREIKKLFDAGVLVNMGGHGQMLGLDAHWEMELFTQGGFSPHDAIQTATINGATYHGLDRDLGSIEVGKLADLVVLSANPLVDIRNTQAIRFVMKNGVLYDGSDASRVYPDPEPMGRMYFHR